MTTARTTELQYDHKEIEARWQRRWAEDALYKARDDDPRPRWYELTMYPYPSGDLHVGHWYAMAPSDAHARFRRMQGYNVLHPMGSTPSGFPRRMPPSTGHPSPVVDDEQHRKHATPATLDGLHLRLGPGGHHLHAGILSVEPVVFPEVLRERAAYRAHAPANWCPSCNTVLANEQVVEDGRCERCDTPVIHRNLNQWFFRITQYADELLDTSQIEWPERILTMQTNWIGRSEGVEIEFDISEYGLDETALATFTTRIDTIFGVTFVVMAPEHPLVKDLTTPENKAEVEAYVERAQRQSEVERLSTEKEKTGVFTGGYCVNRLNGERIPILVADYVLLTYGTGVVMGVPAHDQRDFEFRTKVQSSHQSCCRASGLGR